MTTLPGQIGGFRVSDDELLEAIRERDSGALRALFQRYHGRVYFFVAPAVAEQLDRFALPAAREIVRLAPAALGVNAPLLGAAELAFEPLLADPAAFLRRGPQRMLASA